MPDPALRSDLASCLDGARGADCVWAVLRDACAGLVEAAGGEVAGVLLLVDALGGYDLNGLGTVHALVRADDCL